MKQPGEVLLDLLVEFRRNQEKEKQGQIHLSNEYYNSQQNLLEILEDNTLNVVIDLAQVNKLSQCHKQLNKLFETFENNFKASHKRFQQISDTYYEKRLIVASEIDEFWLEALKGAHDRLGIFAVTKFDEGPLRHLTDVQLILAEDSSFMLKFIFTPNEYFHNDEICKCYQPIEGSSEYSSDCGFIFFKQKKPKGRNFFNFFRYTSDNFTSDTLVGKFFKDSFVPGAILFRNMYIKKNILY